MREYDCHNSSCGFTGVLTDYERKDAQDHDGEDWVCPNCGRIISAVDDSTVESVDW